VLVECDATLRYCCTLREMGSWHLVRYCVRGASVCIEELFALKADIAAMSFRTSWVV